MATSNAEGRPDSGVSHVALRVSDAARSIEFYRHFAGFEVVHQRSGRSGSVVWLSDLEHPFALVLIEDRDDTWGRAAAGLAGIAHLGVACPSRRRVDDLCALAEQQGCLALAPKDSGPPVGYWALLRDPDGNNLELSYGQQVGIEIARAKRRPRRDSPPTSPGI